VSSAEAALVSILTTGSPNPVAALVSTRVYPDVLPQTPTFPAIRYTRISTARSQFRVLSRAGGKATRAQPRFQVDAYALTRAQANAVADAVREVLDGYSGTAASFTIDQAAVEDEGADLEEGVGPGGAPVYRARLDFFISYAE
jgi:hypothetical protein